MAQNKVEIALKLLKNEFVKDSKTAAAAWSRDMQTMRSDADEMAQTWTKGLKETKVASEKLADAQREAATARKRLSDARGDLGLDAVIDQNREVSKLKVSYEELNRSGGSGTKSRTQDQENLRREINKVRTGVEGSAKATDAWSRGMRKMRAEAKGATDNWANGLYKVTKASDALTVAQRKAANERKRLTSARGNLGITSIQQQNREIAKLVGSYNRLSRSGKLSAKEVTQAQEALRRKVAEVRGEVLREGNALKSVGRSLAPYIGVGAAALFAKRLGGSAINAADDYKRLNSQIRLVTNSEEELASTNEKLFQLAQETRSEYDAVVTLYTRTARATKNLGLSQETLLDITRSVNQAMQISGATTQESTSAVIQFTQALQSGVLRGEEFNSISENGARLMTALADGLGVPIEKMRELAEAGELTRDKLIAALTSQSRVIGAEYESLELTVQQAMTQLGNSFQRAVAETDTSGLIESIKNLQDVISDPAVIDGLVNLTGAIIAVAEAGIQAAAGLGDFVALVSGALDLEFGDLSSLEEAENKLKAINTLEGKWYDLNDRDDPRFEQYVEGLEKYRDMLKVVSEFDEDFARSAESRTDERAGIERAAADKILNVNREISAAKESIAQLDIERSKIIAEEELKIAKQNGGELIRQMKQEQSHRQQAINDRLTAAKKAAKDIVDIEKQIVNEKLALQNKLKGIDQSVEGKLFERSLSGKSDNTQQLLLEQRATEKLIEAKKALREGRYDDAAALSQEAQGLSDRISNIGRANALLVEGAEIEKGAAQAASDKRVKSDEEKVALLERYKELQEKAADIEQNMLDGEVEELAELKKELDALGKESPTIKIDSNIEELSKQLEKLTEQLRKVVTEGYKAVGAVSGGHISGFRTGGKLPGYNAGGSVGRQLIMAEDGEWYVPRNIVDHYGAASIAAINQMKLSGFAEGGKLPGYGGGDRRLMNPQVGGFIIRKEAGLKYGDGFMNDLLSKKIPKFNTGGQIRINPALLSLGSLPQLQSGGVIPASSASGVGSVQRHEVVIGEKKFDIFGEQDQVSGLLGALTEVARGG